MNRIELMILVFFVIVFLGSNVAAKIDLVTLPEREGVQLTIYNSADLTLVRDKRNLTMEKGENKLQFSWANTLIDPTSLELLPMKHAGVIDILDLTYPAHAERLGLWHIKSGVSGKVPMEINFFTSGISWKAYYLATLTPDEREMSLEGYVRVINNSGEDYENARVRLVVGKINILERIAELARRYPPYGQPGRPVPEAVLAGAVQEEMERKYERAKIELRAQRPKEIKKEGLSEYFLYTIEGTENIMDGWSKRLPSFKQESVSVVNLYKFEEERFGGQVIRFLSFKNDKAHRLGKEPLPGGLIKVFKCLDEARHLSYTGSDRIKYIPLEEDVELNLGLARNVMVKPKLMAYETRNYVFNAEKGNISGWEEVRTYEVKASNYRSLPVRVEIKRNFPHQYWRLTKKGFIDEYQKIDLDTIKFTVNLPPHAEKTFTYTLTLYQGERREQLESSGSEEM